MSVVILLVYFSSELFMVYKDHTQYKGYSLEHLWKLTQRKVTIIEGTLGEGQTSLVSQSESTASS